MPAKLLIILLFSGSITMAQHIVPDTSFTVYSAYIKAIKKYPAIEIAMQVRSLSVKEDTGIEYCNRAGRKLALDVFYPAGSNNCNGISVIIIHGGGWRSGNRTMHYSLARKLAQLGYTCFTPEYRLSAEAIFPAAVYDVKNAVKWVKQQAALYHTDTSKTVLLGFSAGGELAAFGAATGAVGRFEEEGCNGAIMTGVNALIDIDGTLSFVHPESTEGDDSKKLSAATQWLGVPKNDNMQLWKAASPLTYAGAYTPPTLFINSSVTGMHAGREDYIKILSSNNIYTEVHSFDDSPHTFCLFHPWFDPTIEYIDGFLKRVFVK